MAKLFVSWVINPRPSQKTPPEFGNGVFDILTPEWAPDIMKLELMIQGQLAGERNNTVSLPTVLFFVQMDK